MFYSFDLTIPANTPASAPETLEVDLVPGVIHRVEIQFPRGCVGLVHVQVVQEFHQVWPTNPGADLASDGYTIAWDDAHELVEGQSLLTLVGWNLDDTFPHTITFRFAVLAAAVPPPLVPAALVTAPELETLEVG